MSTDSRFMHSLPQFSHIKPEKIAGLIKNLLDKNRQTLRDLLSPSHTFSWDNLMQPLEAMGDELSKYWSPISHLHSVMESEELRKAYNETLPHLTEYSTEISQNEDLYRAILTLSEDGTLNALDAAQRKIIENDLRDFKLAGIHLPAEKKLRLAELQKQASQLTTKFSENVLDATNGWTLALEEDSRLDGLPEQGRQLLADNAKQRGLTGYVLTLDYPSYSMGMKFLKDRALRRTLYEAFTTRASDSGPNANRWDNAPIIESILKNRHEMAQLVGFANYAEYSLATKMAKKPDEVLHFLEDLLVRAKGVAEAEYKELREFAHTSDQLTDFSAWDAAYYSEKLLEKNFHFTQEDLRPYFPIEKALSGLFAITQKIYGISIRKEENVDVWHPQVSFYSIHDENDQLRGGFYIDLYARPHKRDGAWMDDCITRRRISETDIQLPVAYLTCNFMPPVDNETALLTHDDVLTLFHEFGHCLHHLLTKVDYAAVAGINGVYWDAVEFPSQFMEYYCWEKKSLALIAGHYKTGAPLPDDLFQKMTRAKHFQTGMQMVRQLEFSLFDFRLHLEFDPAASGQVGSILADVRRHTSIAPVPAFNRFQDSFSHIFAGGYAAGYYSYKWAEVLSADAYAQFEENGIFDRKTGAAFMENILEVCGVRDPMLSFVAFRGREPKIDALLHQSGIV